MRRIVVSAIAALLLLGSLASDSDGATGKRWRSTGHSDIPLEFFQGVTSDPRKNLYFDGQFVGLHRTNSRLRARKSNPNVIPAAVTMAEGYNHVGDISWSSSGGGRIMLPLECFYLPGGNTCRTGSIGVADPVTLQWRYYVKLDPAFIDKAMWAEVSPDEQLLWTSSGSGRDLLAYRMSDITGTNAAPAGPPLRPVRQLKGAVPPSGITGATFYRRRLFVAGQNTGYFQVWSIRLGDGSRRLEIERQIVGESEGLDVFRALGGLLHWQITPFRTSGRPPTYGTGVSALVHFLPRRPSRERSR
jgi:hypothetical protein